MKYISKGQFINRKRDGSVVVYRCGDKFHLKDAAADTWLAGQYQVTEAGTGAALEELQHLGLIQLQIGQPDNILDTYRILTNCVICPCTAHAGTESLSSTQSDLMMWIWYAGLRVTMAELVKLRELCAMPYPQYLGERNRQALVELIYIENNIQDRILEATMEESVEMPGTVRDVLQLLRLKVIYLI